MAEFYLDHNVSRSLALALIQLGHNTITAREWRLEGADDDIQLTAATDAGCILVTHNRKDFILLHRVWHRWSHRWNVNATHSGICIIPQKSNLAIHDVAAALHDLTLTTGPDGLANELLEYLRQPEWHWAREQVP